MDIVLTNIINVMKQKGLSQVDFCEKLNLTKNNFTDWKAGRSHSYNKYIYQISDILGVSVEYLKGETDIKQKSPSVDELKADESLLLEVFRSLQPQQKQSLIDLMRNMVEKKEM